MVGTLNQSESCAGGAQRCTGGSVEVCRGAQRGAQRCMEGLAEVVGKKSRFHVRFLNAGI